MQILMNCHVAVNTAAVDEDIEVEVPDDFPTWEEIAQYEYLQSYFDDWMGSNSDAGFGFSVPS